LSWCYTGWRGRGNGAAGLINLGWALVLISRGKRWKSPALAAGGKHVLTDVWTTGAVLIGLPLVPITGWLELDPLVAALVALNILWAGYGMLRGAIGGLMDEATNPEEVTAIRSLIARYAQGAIEAHDVRTRVAGRVTFVECHLVVPGRMAVEDAHEICDRIEEGIRAELAAANRLFAAVSDQAFAATRERESRPKPTWAGLLRQGGGEATTPARMLISGRPAR
jgi:cation diffusion facilitator family transporter